MNREQTEPLGDPLEPVTLKQNLSQLLNRFYTDLRRLARARLRRLPPARTLETTALMHNAYLRLRQKGLSNWRNRRHFFADADQAMRDLIADYVRRKMTRKRGGDMVKVNDPAAIDAVSEPDSPLSEEYKIALLAALEKLQRENEQGAEIVILRYFFGLTIEEIAAVYSRSTRAIQRKWQFARTWLHKELDSDVSQSFSGSRAPVQKQGR